MNCVILVDPEQSPLVGPELDEFWERMVGSQRAGDGAGVCVGPLPPEVAQDLQEWGVEVLVGLPGCSAAPSIAAARRDLARAALVRAGLVAP